MTALRIRLVGACLIVASFATAGSLFAQQYHAVCAAKQHHCGQMATISKCCCGDQDLARDDSTPAQSRADVLVDLEVVPTLPSAGIAVSAPVILCAVQTSPPRLRPLDLPTLFSTFLL